MASKVGNDRTPKIEVWPDLLSLVRPDAGPDRTGSSGRTYRRTVTGPITEPRPDPKTGPTSDGNISETVILIYLKFGVLRVANVNS